MYSAIIPRAEHHSHLINSIKVIFIIVLNTAIKTVYKSGIFTS